MKQRKSLIVLSEFQKWFLIRFVFYTAGFLVAFGIGLFVWFRLIVEEVLNVAGLLSPTFVQTIESHIQLGLWVTAGFLLCLLIVAGLQALIFSRSIAGPVFAIRRHLEKCEEAGRLLPVDIRRGDLFRELAQSLNRLADASPKDVQK